MFSFCNNLHKIYQEDYNKYVNAAKGIESYKVNFVKCEYRSQICNLWVLKSDILSDQNFIIVPSLFNSPEILFFNQEQSYIQYMQSFGNLYLFEWRETTDELSLSDYAKDVAEIIKFIKNKTSADLNLVGHCIGGNIAIFSMFINDDVNSLTLLTTPWDYSHFATSYLLAECLQIKKAIYGLKTVPKIYIQMMFFMLFPNHYKTKINKYFSLDKMEAREKYLKIEQWLQSGVDIPTSLYNEILDELIAKNTLINDNFCINNRLVSLDQITVPTCIISAKEDQIVPISSIAPLQKGIRKSTLISIDGGHISYLVNNDQKFKQAYKKWFTTKI